MTIPDASFREAVRRILYLLSEKRYQELEDLSEPEFRSPASGIRDQAGRYPGTICCPSLADIKYEAYNSENTPDVYIVEATVFTAEEGPSELTALLKVVGRDGTVDRVYFRDLLIQ